MLSQTPSQNIDYRILPPKIGDSGSQLGSNASIASTASVVRLNDDSPRKEMRFALQDTAARLLPDERVHHCCRHVAAINPQEPQLGQFATIDLYADGEGQSRMDNLQTCGSVWHCPVCSARISEERRQELSMLINQNRYDALLVTYTVSHNAGMRLKPLKSALREAYRALKSGRWWQDFKEKWDWIGDVTALEPTHGVNGWHPHLHALMLIDQKTTPYLRAKIEYELKTRWLVCLERVGLSASFERGVDVQYTDSKVRDYVVKFGEEDWTIDHELTKSNSKIGKSGGDTPFQLLLKAGQGDAAAADLFKEYAAAMKGSNQLVWSRGLKELLESEVEEQAEQEPETEWVFVGCVGKSDFYEIARTGYRYQLLRVAAYGEQIEIDRLVGIIKYQSGLTRIRLLEKLFNRCEETYGRNTRVSESERE